MSEHFETERIVARHFRSVGASPPSDAFYDRLLNRADQTHQRPRWLAMLKEPPMRYRSHVAFGSPIGRMTTFAAITILVTLIGAGVVVVGAQSPSPVPQSIAPEPLDPLGASYWTGIFTYSPDTSTVEASDLRISGDWVQVDNAASYPDRAGPGGSFSVKTSSVRIQNADGAWAGTFAGFYKGDSGHEWNVLEGEGAYEGLTAVFLWTWPGSTLEGVILPSAFPAPADPIAPFSE
jgi:hypothetical protein